MNQDTIESDIEAMVYNYFYNGWTYRVESEGHEAVRKDCIEASDRFIAKYKEHVRNEILDEQKKERQEKLNDTQEAVQPI